MPDEAEGIPFLPSGPFFHYVAYEYICTYIRQGQFGWWILPGYEFVQVD